MKMKDYDVIIVGGGPIGGFVSKKIVEKNYNVALFEAKKEIGLPLKCAGLVTKRVFEILKMPEENIVQNEIKGANIHSPSGKILKIGGDKTHALVIDREKFDKKIVKISQEKGTNLFLENKILSVQKKEKLVELKTSKNQEVRCKLVIGTDGPFSTIREHFGFSSPKEILLGIGAEISNTSMDPNFVEIFVGSNIAPGFFAWIIPTNKKGTTARIGLCVNQNVDHPAKYYFSNFLKNKNTKDFFEKIEITRKVGGVVPLGVLSKTFDSNVLLVGDAAAQVKPTSGGGIYTGLLCAGHCASTVIGSLEKNDFSASFLKKYQNLWKQDIGKELSRGMSFRRVFNHLSDKQMDKYIGHFQSPKIVEVINKYGDIDYPSKLVKPLIKKSPSLLNFVPGFLVK